MMRTSPLAKRMRAAAAALLCGTVLSGCVVGPNYVRPSAPVSATFKEAEGWRPAQPMDAIDRGAWWSVYNDPVLDGLERRVEVSNQNLAQAEAAYRSARAAVLGARSGYFPTVSASGGVSHSQSFSGSSTGGGFTGTGAGLGTSSRGGGTSYDLSLDASWVPDLWGRVRRQVEAARANAQSSAADIASARLSYQSELAIDYFNLRVIDEQAALYRTTIANYQRFLQLVINQYNAGTVARANVISAQTQLQSAQASLVGLGVQRAQYEHAIAILVGVPPAQLTIAPATLARNVPVAPVGVASTLLERRPDIAVAERRMAAANAQIGIARSAYYPTVTLSGSLSTAASALGSLFSASNTFWSLGASAADTLLEFGARRAQVLEARAAYDQAVAAYRQTVLGAFQNVEDELATLRVEEQEAALRETELASARLAAQLALNQYRAGQVDYTTVITSEAQALTAEQSVLSVLGARLDASVSLIEALGGGWTTADLPKG